MPKAITNREGRSCLGGSFCPQCYDLKKDGESAEITLYGNVVKSRPLEWDGENIHRSEQNFIVEKEVLDDINALGKCKKLNLRVNSLGGDVHVALNIYDRLRELADGGTEIHCSVDGVAMSAGSMIMCAADHVSVNESSLIMVHRCTTNISGHLNADRLRKEAERQEKYDKVIAACYKRKTGKSEEEIIAMMSHETYMTGKEAYDAGFADELLPAEKGTEIVACADKKSLMIGGRCFDLMGAPAPENIPVAMPKKGNINKPNGGKIMATNFEELLKENPELAEAVRGEIAAKAAEDMKKQSEKAVEDERNRLAEIDKIASQCSPELVKKAKYGDEHITAQELAYKVLLDSAKNGRTFLQDLIDDAENSGTQNVQAAVAPDVRIQGEAGVKTAGLDFMHSVLCGEEKK